MKCLHGYYILLRILVSFIKLIVLFSRLLPRWVLLLRILNFDMVRFVRFEHIFWAYLYYAFKCRSALCHAPHTGCESWLIRWRCVKIGWVQFWLRRSLIFFYMWRYSHEFNIIFHLDKCSLNILMLFLFLNNGFWALITCERKAMMMKYVVWVVGIY